MSETAAVPPSAPYPLKQKRILACVRCQQRKIKCERKFPCAQCIAAREQCLPATRNRNVRRKRRFPERELLERIRMYEDLLRQNNITFEPLHKDELVIEKSSIDSTDQPSLIAFSSERGTEVKYAFSEVVLRAELILLKGAY